MNLEQNVFHKKKKTLSEFTFFDLFAQFLLFPFSHHEINVQFDNRFTPRHIGATSRENLFKPDMNNKDADQHVHPRSLISAFVVRCLDSIIPLHAIAGIS